MQFTTHFDTTATFILTKIEAEKFNLLLNDSDIVLGIVDNDLVQLVVSEDFDTESINLIDPQTGKNYNHLPFIYQIS